MLAVFVRVQLRVFAHLLNFIFGQAAAGRNRDLLLFARAKVLRADVQDAIGVDIECHFDLRHTARRGRNIRKLELADRFIVSCKLALALENVDFHARLIIRGGRKYFRFARGNCRISLDQLREHSTEGFNAE